MSAWYDFDGRTFTHIADPMNPDESDWTREVERLGWSQHEQVIPNDYAFFKVDIHTSRESSDLRTLVCVSVSDTVLCTVICIDAPAFLVFARDYLNSLISMAATVRGVEMLDRIDETLFDDQDGLPAVQRHAQRRSRERAYMKAERERAAAEKAKAKAQ